MEIFYGQIIAILAILNKFDDGMDCFLIFRLIEMESISDQDEYLELPEFPSSKISAAVWRDLCSVHKISSRR